MRKKYGSHIKDKHDKVKICGWVDTNLGDLHAYAQLPANHSFIGLS